MQASLHQVRFLRMLLCLALVLAFGSDAVAQIRSPLLRRRTEQLAPPPVFDRATEEIFFSDALDHVGSREARASADISRSPIASRHEVDPPSGGALWSSVIAAETLEVEVKRLSPIVDGHVKSLAHFRTAGYRLARRDFSHLAALFGIAAEYDRPVRWKEHAASLRDAFGRAGQNCKAGSDASFREAQARAQDLRDLIRGARPGATVGEAATWEDAVDRGPLMLVMETLCQDRLDSALIDSRQWSRSREQVAREAELLSALAIIIQREGYEYAADETYQQHARALQEACQQLRGAALDADLQQARQALSAVRVSCEQCHVDFRG